MGEGALTDRKEIAYDPHQVATGIRSVVGEKVKVK